MRTIYIRFYQAGDDPVWGLEVFHWIRSDLVRVHRNNLCKAVFEWVGSNSELTPDQLAYYRKNYPVVMQVNYE